MIEDGDFSTYVRPKRPKDTVGVGMPTALLLHEFGSHLWFAFKHTAYHVGSSLTKPNWRDVDVRVMLPDEEYVANYGDPENPHRNGKWVADCLAFSALGKQITGLPIDFQIQHTTTANKDSGIRSALGFTPLRAFRPLKSGIDHIGYACVFYCHDINGRILLGKRTENCRDEQGCWDPGGGELEFGERTVDAVKREVKEEYGVDVAEEDIRQIGTREVQRRTAKYHTHWIAFDHMVFIRDHEAIRNCEPKKQAEVKWFVRHSLPSPLHSQFPLFLNKYRDYIVERERDLAALRVAPSPERIYEA